MDGGISQATHFPQKLAHRKLDVCLFLCTMSATLTEIEKHTNLIDNPGRQYVNKVLRTQPDFVVVLQTSLGLNFPSQMGKTTSSILFN